MNKISIRAVVLAFLAELGVDIVIGYLMLIFMGGDRLSAEMSHEEFGEVATAITRSGDFMFWSMVLGTATIVGGGYLAARLAKTFPYYNGLAIGVVGLVYTALFVNDVPAWYAALALLLSVPAAIYGAHLAKQHMTATP